MLRHLPAVSAATLLLAGVAGATPLGAAELALERVLLSTGGVGYFEYEAPVSGDESLDLTVRLDQVDDVLKSLVVFDDGGEVGTVSLPGREPLSVLFQELPFDSGDLERPADLLSALSGRSVAATGPRALTGRIVAVNEEEVAAGPDGEILTRHRVTLKGAAGLQSFILEDAESIRFTDAETEEQLDRALEAIARLAARDRRTLQVSVADAGPRTVRAGYVVGVPLWKASYRLALPPAGDESGEARLQGWAVVENLSGAAWDAVTLTLASGNPVTFRQALYDAYFVDRPEVPVEVFGRVLPGVDSGGVAPAPPAAEVAMDRKRTMQRMAPADALAAAPAEPAAAAESDAAMAGATAAERREATTQVLFRLPDPVSIGDGETALVPLGDWTLPVERLSLYDPSVGSTHPLAAVRIENALDTSLPPGVLTLYETGSDSGDGGVAFLGDARLGPTPPGESRLLSYAVDGKVTVDHEASQDTLLRGLRLVDGVMVLREAVRQVITYGVKGAPDAPRTVLIEQPRRRGGFTLVEPEDPAETTADAYRFRVAVAAGGSATLRVVLEHETQQRIALDTVPSDRLAYFAENRQLDPEQREAFAELQSLAGARAAAERRIASLEEGRREVAVEQDRLRDNLAAVPRDSDVYGRFLDKLDESESRMEALGADLSQARRDLHAAEEELARFIKSLDL